MGDSALGVGVRVDVNGEVIFCKKKKFFWGGVGRVGWGVGGEGGCERRIEVFVKFKKKKSGGGGGRGRVGGSGWMWTKN